MPGRKWSAILLFFLLVFTTELTLDGSRLEDGRSSPSDPVEVMRLAVAKYIARELTLKDYTYVENERGRTPFDAGSNTYEIILLDGHPYRRHTRFNGQALPPEEEKEEQARLAAAWRRIGMEGEVRVLAGNSDQGPRPRTGKQLADDRSSDPQIAAMQESVARLHKEVNDNNEVAIRQGWSPGFGMSRFAMVPSFKKYIVNLRLPLSQLPALFDIRFTGTEILGSRKTYVLEANPKAPYVLIERPDADVQNFKLKIWVDEAETQIVKAEGKAISDGFLSKIDDFVLDSSNLSPKVAAKVRELLPNSRLLYSRGTVVTMQWARVNDEVWLPSKIHINGVEEVVYPKPRGNDVKFVNEGTPTEYDIVFSDYKKFRVDARILPQN